MIFEPTGDLSKDYSAYCEIDQLNERDDILDGMFHVDGKTTIRIRNTEYCLNKRDASALCSAIPHCTSLTSVELTGCGLTEHSLKLFAEALYKSSSVQTLVADFNATGLLKDPTVTKKDKNEVVVFTNQYRGAHLKPAEPEAKDDPKKKDAKKPVAKDREEPSEKLAIAIPTGWHSLLLSGLQVISLRGNGITDGQVELIASTLASNQELLSLNLWGNTITTSGVKHLASALQSNRRLTCLDIGHNAIDDDGVSALMRCFLTSDVTNDEAMKLRQKVCGPTAELPLYPTYTDLVATLAQPADEKKDPKKKEPPKKKGVEGPVERHKGDFDKDCVRLDESRVRVPGNNALWCINLSQNVLITGKAVALFEATARRREPTLEEIYNDGNIKEPAPYLCSFPLRHFIIEHTKLDRKLQESINSTIQQLAV